MNVQKIVEDLTLRNRAYNLLYALGESPETVRTLTSEETFRLINLARETYAGTGQSTFHRMIRDLVPVHQLRYVATGRI